MTDIKHAEIFSDLGRFPGARALLDATIDIGHEHAYRAVLDTMARFRRRYPDDEVPLRRLARAISERLPAILMRTAWGVEFHVQHTDSLDETVEGYLGTVQSEFERSVDSVVAECARDVGHECRSMLRQACHEIAARMMDQPKRLDGLCEQAEPQGAA
jgi:hypothetical protein